MTSAPTDDANAPGAGSFLTAVAPWRRLVRLLSWTYLAVVVIGCLALQTIGERWWLTGVALYLPPLSTLAPLLLLAPAALLLSPKSLWLHAAAVLVVLAGPLRLTWNRPVPPGDSRVLSVMSNNTGERKLADVVALAARRQPDFVALQDVAPVLEQELRRALPGYHFSREGEFTLASRFPILRHDPLVHPAPGAEACAARFEVDCGGRPLAVYNVHLPTPRHDLEQLRGRSLFRSLLALRRFFSSELREAFGRNFAQRLALAQRLAARIGQEKAPFLIVGDLNSPSAGQVRPLFAAIGTDFFAATGRGFGLTFPGTTRNPLALFGPWLRIDYLFAGPGLEPLATEVEPPGPAQHLAVFGQFRFAPVRPAP